MSFKQAKRKRIAELSGGLLTRENRQKSHWDFVVEEMAWLANDFAQVSSFDMHLVGSTCSLSSSSSSSCFCFFFPLSKTLFL